MTSEGYNFDRKGGLSTENHNLVSIIFLCTIDNGIRRNLWRMCTIRHGLPQIGLHTDFIPKALLHKRVKCLGTALNDERLDMVCIKTLQIQRMGMVDDEAFGILASPFTDIQLGMVTLICDSPHEDSVFLSTEFMREHLGEIAGDLRRLVVIVDKTIGCLGPFKDDIRAFLPMKCEKTTVELLTLLFQDTHLNFNTGLTEFLDTSTLHFCKFIDTADDHPTHTFLDNQIGTRRRFSEM